MVATATLTQPAIAPILGEIAIKEEPLHGVSVDVMKCAGFTTMK